QRLTQVSQPFALYLASNKPHKNLPRLVEAWRIVVATLGDRAPRLVIAGHYDPRYPEAQQLVSALGLEHKVVFVGLVSDAEATALYSTCALFVFPSLYEGFGLTPLEAMACGAPVACSNTSSLPEVVGDAAVLFDPHRADDIAAACLRMLTDETLQANLRQASLRQAARFSWREAAARTLEVYRAIAR
ncbi:MAG: glycosyltransferase family 4 protein, partial [Thermoflexales bacterium]|nr:glycosyltransferase family 4 protein [Thermoflexales bacterium]